MKDLIVIFVSNSIIEVNVLRNSLEAENIESYIKDEHTSQALPMLIGGVKVLVSTTDLERAKKILQELGLEQKIETSQIESGVNLFLQRYIFDEKGNYKPILKNLALVILILFVLYLMFG